MFNRYGFVAGLLSAVTAGGVSYADVIVSDTAGYTSVDDARDVWKNNSVGLSSTVTTAGQSVTPTSGQFLTLNNSYTYMNLPQTIHGDWTLSALVLMPSYGRKITIGLTNAEGTQGYFGSWDSSNANQYGGNGRVFIGEYASANAPNSSNPPMTQLGTTAGSDHPALGYAVTGTSPVTYSTTFSGLALLELSWNAADHTLILKMDGILKCTFKDDDNPYASFSRLYMFAYGSGDTVIDNVTLSTTVPEAASAGVLGSFAGAMLLSRKR